MIFELIGIGNKRYEPTEEVQALISVGRVFSGGKRHLELVRHLLPQGFHWIPVKSPMEEVYAAYDKHFACQEQGSIVVFASGDPLFYGIGGTLKARYPSAKIYIAPCLSAIQLLVRRTGIDSSKLQTVSIHGRSWAALDTVIISQEPLIGVLTDVGKSPGALAARLLDYGYDNYTLWVGEDLEGPAERVRCLSLAEASGAIFHSLNCVILQKTYHRKIPFGLPDHLFAGLEGRPNMITKMPVRLCTLHALELESASVLWDIGFCTGSLSIEARLRFPALGVYAFERRRECLNLMKQNVRQFGAPGINARTGDFFDEDLSLFPRPQSVFIGGHGGRLPELIPFIDVYLEPGAVIVLNAVQESSVTQFILAASKAGWKIQEPLKLSIDAHNEITIMKAIK